MEHREKPAQRASRPDLVAGDEPATPEAQSKRPAAYRYRDWDLLIAAACAFAAGSYFGNIAAGICLAGMAVAVLTVFKMPKEKREDFAEWFSDDFDWWP